MTSPEEAKTSSPVVQVDVYLLQLTGAGKWRFRKRLPSGEYICPRVFDTYEEAREERDKYLRVMRECAAPGGLTLGAFGERWVQELTRVFEKSSKMPKAAKALNNLTSHFDAHIKKSDLARQLLRAITHDDVKDFVDWLATRETQWSYVGERDVEYLAPRTRRHIVTTLRKMFDDAVEEKKCTANPVGTINIPLTVDERVSKQVPRETPLTKNQQKQLIAAFGDNPEVLMVIFVMWVGLRLGELMNLELVDVHLDEPDPSDPTGQRKVSYIDVLYGAAKHQPPKGGKTRRVFLFGEGKRALQRWVTEILPTYAPHNPHGLVFCTPQVVTANGVIQHEGGARRDEPPRSFQAIQESGVMGRRIWWHALRHTCATSLLNDWFGLGRRWRIIEIGRLLGQSSKEVTEMYAHLDDSAMGELADEAERAYVRVHESQQEPAPAPPAPTPAPPPPTSLPSNILDGLQALARSAFEQGNWSMVQSLGTLIDTQKAGSPPAAVPVPPPAAAPIPPPPAPVPPPVPNQPLLRAPVRTGRRVRSPRASRVASGDTEGPRRTGGNAQLDPTSGTGDPPVWLPLVIASAESSGRGLSPSALAEAMDLRAVAPSPARRAPDEPGTTRVHPSPRPDGPVLNPSNAAPSAVSNAPGVPGVHPEALAARPTVGVYPGYTPSPSDPPKSWPRTGHENHNSKSFHIVDLISLRSTEPKVEGSNPSGRAKRFPIVSSLSGEEPWPTNGQASSPEVFEVEKRTSAPFGGAIDRSSTPAWLSVLQTVGSGTSPEWRPIHPAPTPAPQLGPKVTENHAAHTRPLRAPQAPVIEPPARPREDHPPMVDVSGNELLVRAQRVMRFAAASRQDVRRESEELAQLVLLSSDQRAHHEVARLVLRTAEENPDLTIPHGLQLAVQLIGGGQKKRGKRKSTAKP